MEEKDCRHCSEEKEGWGTLKPTPKRLVVCCDGTNYESDKGYDKYPSNVGRLSHVIAKTGVNNQGAVTQLVYYQSGVATGFFSWLSGKVSKNLQGAFGWGLNEKVCEAYFFLANNYSPGDEIFLFGFSRGAYTARALASLICQVGLLLPSKLYIFDEIWEAYRKGRLGGSIKDSKWGKEICPPGQLGTDPKGPRGAKTRFEALQDAGHLHIKIKAVGVWDTVGSIGISFYVEQPGVDGHFHSTRIHPKIEHAFQALALDESRGNFPPTLYYLTKEAKKAGVVLRQCWFPGYHADIGGYDNGKDDRNAIDEVSFAWMCDQINTYLQLSIRDLTPIFFDRIDNYGKSLKPDKLNEKGRVKVAGGVTYSVVSTEAFHRKINWKDGGMTETNSFFWSIMSFLATLRLWYIRRPGETVVIDEPLSGVNALVDTMKFLFLRLLIKLSLSVQSFIRSVLRLPRETSTVPYEDYCEEVHPIVQYRILNSKYKSKSLKSKHWKRRSATGSKGFEWVKKRGDGSEVKLREYQIPAQRWFDMDPKPAYWVGSMDRELAPKEYMKLLDSGYPAADKNGVRNGL